MRDIHDHVMADLVTAASRRTPMTAAERQRRHRAKRKADALANATAPAGASTAAYAT